MSVELIEWILLAIAGCLLADLYEAVKALARQCLFKKITQFRLSFRQILTQVVFLYPLFKKNSIVT